MSSNSSTVDPNFDDGPMLINVLTPMAVVVTLVVALRIFMKLRRQYKLDLDDWLGLVALVLSWAFYGTTMALVIQGGLGKPLEVVLAEGGKDLIRYNYRIQYACEVFYATTIMTIKMSILAMHWRLFPTRTTKIAYITLGSLTILWCLAILLVTSFKCQPLGKTFDPYIEGYCVNNWDFFLAFGIPNIITDAGILALAIYKVTHLQLPLMKRIGLSAVFLAGACAVAASCIRLYYYCLLEIEDANGRSAEVTTTEVDSVLWANLEADLAIICSSLTAWGPVLSHISSQVWSLLSGGSSSRLTDKVVAAPHTFRTFGGTTVHRLQGSMDGKPSGSLARKDKKFTNRQRQWFDQLSGDEIGSTHEYEVDDRGHVLGRGRSPSLVPQTYGAERNTFVDSRGSTASDEIPLGTIGVKTAVDQKVDWESVVKMNDC